MKSNNNNWLYITCAILRKMDIEGMKIVVEPLYPRNHQGYQYRDPILQPQYNQIKEYEIWCHYKSLEERREKTTSMKERKKTEKVK